MPRVVESQEELASVSKDVFPALLGPVSRNEGKEVVDAERYATKWSSRGIEKAMMSVTHIARGVGPRREDNQLEG